MAFEREGKTCTSARKPITDTPHMTWKAPSSSSSSTAAAVDAKADNQHPRLCFSVSRSEKNIEHRRRLRCLRLLFFARLFHLLFFIFYFFTQACHLYLSLSIPCCCSLNNAPETMSTNKSVKVLLRCRQTNSQCVLRSEGDVQNPLVVRLTRPFVGR